MPGDLSLLARQTLSSPATRVLTDGRPNKLGAHGLARSLDARMTKTMDGIEYTPTRCKWYVRSKRAVTDVDDELGGADVDGFEIESGPCVGAKLPKLGIEWLLSSNCLPVNTEVTDRCYDAIEVGERIVLLLRRCGSALETLLVGDGIRIGLRN